MSEPVTRREFIEVINAQNRAINQLIKEYHAMSAEFDSLKASVATLTTTVTAVETEVTTTVAKLTSLEASAAGNVDPASVTALQQQVEAANTQLSGALQTLTTAVGQ